MTCEKQFVPHDDKHLYCSDACRRIDQSSSAHATMPRSYAAGNYPFYSAGSPEPRDIIPPASPSRPTSMFFSQSPPMTPGTSARHSSAIASLRSLNLNDPKERPPSPPSPTGSTSNFWPFSGRSSATSPSNSYIRPSVTYMSSTYDTGYGGAYYTLEHQQNHGGMDRPLPSRNPSGYSRPKSIELVTPVVGGW